MKKYFILFLLGLSAFTVRAQIQPTVPVETAFGKIDMADLEMTSCDFEKDANAMVLFDRAEMACGIPEILMERQKRIKIFYLF
jgi:hypothetical protein